MIWLVIFLLIQKSQVKERAKSFNLAFKMDKAAPICCRLVARLITSDQVDFVARMMVSVPPTLLVSRRAAARCFWRVDDTNFIYTAKS